MVFEFVFFLGRPCLVDAAISNGKFDKPIGSIVASGSNLSIKCNEGFVVKSVEKVTCQDGKLSVGKNTGCRVSSRSFQIVLKFYKNVMDVNFFDYSQ